MIQHVIINLDKPRKLRMGMGAMVDYEQEFGQKLADIDDDSVSVETLARLLWVMLRRDDPALTFAQVLDLVDEHAESLEYVSKKIWDAIRIATSTGAKIDPNA